MSREILFRGKSKSFSSWEYGCLIQSRGEYFIGNTVGNDPENWCYVYPETVGQFTGLLDKKGNRIFEGDILSVDAGDEICNTEIFWDNNLGGYADRRDFDGDSFRCYEGDMTWVKYYQIIGNIHDNPELIGKEVSHV